MRQVTAGLREEPFLPADFFEEAVVAGDFFAGDLDVVFVAVPFLMGAFFLVVPVCALAPHTRSRRAAISRDGKKRFIKPSG